MSERSKDDKTTPTEKPRLSRFPSAGEDSELLDQLPQTPQTMAPAYRLAFNDADFLRLDELRAVRLQLELTKTEMILQAKNISSTVIMFGGARIPAPGEEPGATTAAARKSLAQSSKYYDEARKFARYAARESMNTFGREFVVATGGGPGIMEAGNLGAHEVGGASVGFNIMLPNEPTPNDYITPDLCFNFHYFAIRKMHFLMRAKAIAVFPGGFGTLDELFEVLTLIQTERMDPVPIMLFARGFWEKIINFDALVEAGTISPEDLELFHFVETADEAWGYVCGHYGLEKPKAE